MKMDQEYIPVEMEIVPFESRDVIATSRGENEGDEFEFP